ncbi:MAG: hypothetical protein NTU61_06560 [Candidatus Altiarchaeota archaeon]|nr:hypothetical protein [Candidatus Altiarchaeota archaeon]
MEKMDSRTESRMDGRLGGLELDPRTLDDVVESSFFLDDRDESASPVCSTSILAFVNRRRFEVACLKLSEVRA